MLDILRVSHVVYRVTDLDRALFSIGTSWASWRRREMETRLIYAELRRDNITVLF